jgi:prepilin-type N-terminal cleavage/methylation domain-containing protein
MKTMLSLARDQRGFSLAELLIVIAILGLMLTGLLAVQMQGQKSYLIGSHRVEAQQNGRVALELMVRELRSAQSVTVIPSATDMTFVDKNGNTIQYQLTGSVINRITGGVTTPLIGGVVAFNLTYFSDYNGATNTGTTTAVAGNVSSVRLQLVTGTEESVASYSDANQRATMEMLVRLRNHV